MKFKKESVWILLATVTVPFYFVCRDTIEVEDGVVHVYKTTWWCKRSVVKSLNASCVGEVRKKLHAVGSSSLCEIEVFDNRDQLFWVQTYQGFDKLDRCCQDAVALKHAVKTGNAFSATYCKSGGWALLLMFISLFVWVYKRAWRLERERQSNNDLHPVAKDAMDKFSPPRTFRFKLRNGNGKKVGKLNADGRRITALVFVLVFLPSISVHGKLLLPIQNSSKMWGYCDTEGVVVIPYIFKDARPFEKGFAEVEDAHWVTRYIDECGEIATRKGDLHSYVPPLLRRQNAPSPGAPTPLERRNR